MSKKYSAANTSPAPPGPADRPDSPTVVPVLGSDAARALWDALAARPGVTAAALADVSGVGLSTARRLLTNWEVVGAAASLTDLASPRAAKAWTTGSAAPESESTTTKPVTPAEDADRGIDALDTAPESPAVAPTGGEATDPVPAVPSAPAAAATVDAESTVRRLPAGALRGHVEDFLHDHPGQEFTPHRIGNELDRSSGAVHNALVKLTGDGTARQTCTSPKKFTLAS
ncbi:hypothetical protein [Nocardia sp. MW-W600-9]